MNRQNEILREIKTISKDNQNESYSLEQGLADPVLSFVTSKIDENDRDGFKYWIQRKIISTIQENEPKAPEVFMSPSISDSRRIEFERRILESLYYDGMDDRESRVAAAYESTFQWIFKDRPEDERKWNSFKDWLGSDAQLYWITGKAGSGKSTLMKYIRITKGEGDQPRCAELLLPWTRGSQLYIGNFFFWNSGIALQKKQIGLFRSLLYQLLDQNRRLIEQIASKRWEALALFNHDPLDWSESELRGMLRDIAHCLAKDSKLCLFVDGLDELEGNHKDLINLFHGLTMNPRIKLCVASRPWVEFEDAFKGSPSLKLQDLTYSDMKVFVSSQVESNEGFKLLSRTNPEYAGRLVESIITKSSGVFLWVKLVVTSILGGMTSGDRISDLQRRLDALPADLEHLYDDMLNSLDPFYLEHAAQLFLRVDLGVYENSLLCMALSDNEDCFLSVMQQRLEPIDRSERELLHETMRRRLNSRCKGLIETLSFKSPSEDLDKFRVEYLHRTVKDYIERHDIQQKLTSALKSPYDPYLRRCIGYLAQLKGLPWDQGQDEHEVWDLVLGCLVCAQYTSQESSPQLRNLIDELNSVCSKRRLVQWPPVNPVYETQPWIVAFMDPKESLPFNGHMWSLAVRFRLRRYLDGMLKPDCLVPACPDTGMRRTYHLVCSHDKNKYPLLLDSITDIPQGYGRIWHFLSPSSSTISFLLDRGADPNMVISTAKTNTLKQESPTPEHQAEYHGKQSWWANDLSSNRKTFTIWQAALSAWPENTYESFPLSEQWQIWVKIYKLFLDHGAGRFPGNKRAEAHAKIDILLQKAIILENDWKSLIYYLAEGEELPKLYETETISSFATGTVEESTSVPPTTKPRVLSTPSFSNIFSIPIASFVAFIVFFVFSKIFFTHAVEL